MKSIKYILAISFALLLGKPSIEACGPFYPSTPDNLSIFRVCTRQLENQWQEGGRFQDYEKKENCLLWQKLTSKSIPLRDIEEVVYECHLKDIKAMPEGVLSDNKFAAWLVNPKHRDDLNYILVAKEIEEIREHMNNPWYYAYEGDEEHLRLNELMAKCNAYKGKRHAERYALQIVRLYIAQKEYQKCIDLWESKVNKMPQSIVTDIIASYVGGAYYQNGNRDKAIELYTLSQDIGSLIFIKAWDDAETRSTYTDARVKELEYVFNRFPNSPLLSVKLQKYVRNRERYIHDLEEDALWEKRDSAYIRNNIANYERVFYTELKRFATAASSSKKCNQKGMWNYALAYLYYLDGDDDTATQFLSKAEKSKDTQYIKDSVKAFRFLMDARHATNTDEYRSRLLVSLKWLDKKMLEDQKEALSRADYRNSMISLMMYYYGETVEYDNDPYDYWQYDNKMNWSFYYWQDVARKVLLSEVCPRIKKSGNTTLSLQLANYATNRITQLLPPELTSKIKKENFKSKLPIEQYRRTWSESNRFDYSSQFFDCIDAVTAAQAARYAETIIHPRTAFDRFFNERSYVETDYIFDIVGTHYLREMNYPKASEWLAKVSAGYQARTNLGKGGYYWLDPFKYQYDEEHRIADSNDFKLNFAQEMVKLEQMMSSNIEPNRKANAKIRYAIGMRNSFGKCWYLTQYGYKVGVDRYEDWESSYGSSEREGFKKNPYAQKAYKTVDRLIAQAMLEFTDPEEAAQAQLDMLNFKTVMQKYPGTKAAAFVKSRCDNYYDYCLQKQ